MLNAPTLLNLTIANAGGQSELRICAFDPPGLLPLLETAAIIINGLVIQGQAATRHCRINNSLQTRCELVGDWYILEVHTSVCKCRRKRNFTSAPCFFCLLLLWWLMSPPAPTAATDHGMIFLLWHGNSSGSDYSESLQNSDAHPLHFIATVLLSLDRCLLGVIEGHFLGLE